MNRCTRVRLKEWPNVLVLENGDGSGEECREYDLSTPAGRASFSVWAAAAGFDLAQIGTALMDFDDYVAPCLLLSLTPPR